MKQKTENKYWWLFASVGVWLTAMILEGMHRVDTEELVLPVMALLLIGSSVWWSLHKGADRMETLLLVFLGASFFLRLLYCVDQPFNCSLHDLGTAYPQKEGWYQDGHLGYLQEIFQKGALPEGDPREKWSFYNPPFFYVVAALMLKVQSLFGISMPRNLENLQLFTMFFATAAIQVSVAILREFQIKGKALLLSVALVPFHPYFFLGGAALNNDMLSVLAIFVTLLYTIRWYKEMRTSHIVILAFSIGLGMMTKLSVGLIAVMVAIVFLIKFYKSKQYLACIKQFVLFGVLCIPLGMYWPIRNAVLFGMPLVYVQALPLEDPQFVGYDVLKRLSLLDLQGWKDPFLRFNAEVDYNLWTCLAKTAVFDEKSVEVSQWQIVMVAKCLLYTGVGLGGTSVVLEILHIVRREASRLMLAMKALVVVLFLGSYIKFCFQFPMICSMNFRYVVPVLLVIAVNVGLYEQSSKAKRAGKALIGGISVLFVLSSIVVYGVLQL